MTTSDHTRFSDETLASCLQFEKLISDMSVALLAAHAETLDLQVEGFLERARTFFDVDRCALLSVSADHQVVKVCAASCAEGAACLSDDMDCALAFPWSLHRLLVEHEPVQVSRLADLPPESAGEHAAWMRMPMHAALMLPLGTEASVEYVIVLATARREHAWPETVVTRLRVLGEMLAGAMQRQVQIDRFRELDARAESGADLAGLAFYEVNFVAGTAHIDTRFSELLGVPPDRQQGLGALEFWTENLHPDDRARVLEIRQNLHDGRLPQVATEYRFLHPTRGEMWVDHLGCVSKRNPGGQALVTFGVLRDITDRKRIEEEHRELSQRLIRAHEAERALIARELHDDVSQRLAVLSIDVGRTELEATDPLQAKAMQGVRQGLIRLSEDVHSMAYHLHPSILEELGLAEALHAECERRGRQCEVEISANILSLPDVIAEDVALCLFRVAQEALHNVARHAGARSATVMLQEVDEGLLLAVRDDGVGFDPQHRRTGRHLGLASMRERVHLARGSLDIESTPGHGTAIVAWLPHSRDSR